jgi:hypothetical protein
MAAAANRHSRTMSRANAVMVSAARSFVAPAVELVVVDVMQRRVVAF